MNLDIFYIDKTDRRDLWITAGWEYFQLERMTPGRTLLLLAHANDMQKDGKTLSPAWYKYISDKQEVTLLVIAFSGEGNPRQFCHDPDQLPKDKVFFCNWRVQGDCKWFVERVKRFASYLEKRGLELAPPWHLIGKSAKEAVLDFAYAVTLGPTNARLEALIAEWSKEQDHAILLEELEGGLSSTGFTGRELDPIRTLFRHIDAAKGGTISNNASRSIRDECASVLGIFRAFASQRVHEIRL